MRLSCYKIFMADGGQVLGAVLHGGLLIRSCQRRGSFTNVFFSNLKSVKILKFLPISKGYTLEDKTLTNLQSY